MNTELKNAVKATDSKAQYDTSAKRLLGQKSILAHILVKTVDEYKGMNPKDVVDCIEGTPHISTVPVEPGLTNAASEKNGERLVGFNTENEEINEGLVRFDIVFYVLKPTSLSPFFLLAAFVSPGSTGTVLICGVPSMQSTTSLGFMPLNSSTVFTSICASMLFCPNRRFALVSYCAFESVTFTAFFNSVFTGLPPFCNRYSHPQKGI